MPCQKNKFAVKSQVISAEKKNFQGTTPIKPVLNLKPIIKLEKSVMQTHTDSKMFELAAPVETASENMRILNIISALKLPQDVLGQNLFPRKYHAFFEINNEERTFNFKLTHLIPLNDPLPYVDKVVFNAFLRKLGTVDLTGFKQYLSSLNHGKAKENDVDIFIEFKESND